MVSIMENSCQVNSLRRKDEYRTIRQATMRKEDRIGLRVSAELKRTLVQISRSEGRSLAQVCEIFLRGATSAYKEEGTKYLQRLLARQKKESSE